MPYRIKTVADILGVPRATLLAWERRYSVVAPARHENGYRAYSEDDIAVLRSVKQLVDQGLKVSEAVSRVRERTVAPANPQVQALDAVREEMIAALMSFDRDRALVSAQKVSMMSFANQLEQLYAPLLRSVGEAWCEGRATISQEHFATGFVRERVTAMLVALNSGPRGGGQVLCSGYATDPHELPVLILATHLSLAGFRVTSIGVSVPVGALARAARDSGAQLVSVTVTMPQSAGQLDGFFSELVDMLPDGCVVAVGGTGVPPDYLGSDRIHVPQSVDGLVSLGRTLRLSA